MKKTSVVLLCFLLMSLLSFSQNSSKQKDSDFLISEQGFGMLVDGVDTFAVVNITYIKAANGIMIERNFYRNLSDSLKSVDIVRADLISDRDSLIADLERQIGNYKDVTGLEKEEADDCEEKYDKLVKKYKRAKTGNKILGGFGGVALIVILALLI